MNTFPAAQKEGTDGKSPSLPTRRMYAADYWSAHTKSAYPRMAGLLAAGILITNTLIVACTSKQSQQSAVLQEAAVFHDSYLHDNPTDARLNLEKAIEVFQDPKAQVLNPSGRAGLLYFDYARLYALDKHTGDDLGAEIALIKARYWNVCRYELSHSLTNTDNIKEMQLFNEPGKLIDVAARVDKIPSHGAGPAYLNLLPPPTEAASQRVNQVELRYRRGKGQTTTWIYDNPGDGQHVASQILVVVFPEVLRAKLTS